MTETDTQPETPPVPTTTTEVLALIHRERAALEAALSGLSEAELTAAKPPDGWSIKDHLLHLVAWQEVLLGALAGEAEHVTLGLEECVLSELKMDDLNALFYRRNRDVPVSQALATFASVQQKVLAAVGRLSDEELTQPCEPVDAESTTRIDKIRWNTYEHDQEHRSWLGL